VIVVLLAAMPAGDASAALSVTSPAFAAGAASASSASFAMSATVGQAFAGTAHSAIVLVRAGFWSGVAASPTVGVDELAGAMPAFSRLRNIAPNPFAGSTAITFDLARASGASVRLYDTAGRLVRSLVDHRLAAGTHRFEWDGRGPHGGPLEAGIYYCRFDGDGIRETRRIALVR
jgi:hypothetical protein